MIPVFPSLLFEYNFYLMHLPFNINTFVSFSFVLHVLLVQTTDTPLSIGHWRKRKHILFYFYLGSGWRGWKYTHGFEYGNKEGMEKKKKTKVRRNKECTKGRVMMSKWDDWVCTLYLYIAYWVLYCIVCYVMLGWVLWGCFLPPTLTTIIIK